MSGNLWWLLLQNVAREGSVEPAEAENSPVEDLPSSNWLENLAKGYGYGSNSASKGD